MTRSELVAAFLRAREAVEVIEAESRELAVRSRQAVAVVDEAERALLEDLTGGDLHVGTAKREVSIVVAVDDAGAALIIQTRTGWSRLDVTPATLETLVGRRAADGPGEAI